MWIFYRDRAGRACWRRWVWRRERLCAPVWSLAQLSALGASSHQCLDEPRCPQRSLPMCWQRLFAVAPMTPRSFEDLEPEHLVSSTGRRSVRLMRPPGQRTRPAPRVEGKKRPGSAPLRPQVRARGRRSGGGASGPKAGVVGQAGSSLSLSLFSSSLCRWTSPDDGWGTHLIPSASCSGGEVSRGS